MNVYRKSEMLASKRMKFERRWQIMRIFLSIFYVLFVFAFIGISALAIHKVNDQGAYDVAP